MVAAALYHPDKLNSPLDSAAVLSCLLPDTARLLRSLEIVGTLDSTNAELLRRPADRMHGVALVATEQKEGRGRVGKSWCSPPHAGVYFSCGWVSTAPPPLSLPLSVAAGVATTLTQLGLMAAKVREPNDIYVADAKLGGILVEGRGNGKHSRNVVGIGINTEPHLGRDSLDCKFTDLRSEGVCVNPSILLAGLINLVLPLLARQLS
ncbi:MAG: biotin--[acetyl-CoA-carboxylase] ligase [Candidatus Porifericomitaceae bacterium WSBS_2022_MAG_OTU9]